jgi:plasmid stabilization system protein ParE
MKKNSSKYFFEVLLNTKWHKAKQRVTKEWHSSFELTRRHSRAGRPLRSSQPEWRMLSREKLYVISELNPKKSCRPRLV